MFNKIRFVIVLKWIFYSKFLVIQSYMSLFFRKKEKNMHDIKEKISKIKLAIIKNKIVKWFF